MITINKPAYAAEVLKLGADPVGFSPSILTSFKNDQRIMVKEAFFTVQGGPATVSFTKDFPPHHILPIGQSFLLTGAGNLANFRATGAKLSVLSVTYFE